MKIWQACLCLSLVACEMVEVDYDWEIFKLVYDKEFQDTWEEAQRHDVFLENKRKISAHNALFKQGLVSYALGINNFSDRFPEELAALTSLAKFSEAMLASSASRQPIEFDDVTLPDSVDWREKGAVTPVKNQMHCESCWAFSTTGSLEGQHFLKYGKLVSLSEQNLVDCVKNPNGQLGCEGNLMEKGYEYVKKNGGIDTEDSYPYLAKDGTCHYDPKTSGANCTGYVILPGGDEDQLKVAVANVGPVSVAIHASSDMKYYKQGVYRSEECRNDTVNHAVLVVGYGTTPNGTDYWLVKNSWGWSFGLQGYIMIARNQNNMCGIASYASYPVM
uniref:Cathepsin L2 n=1 Tax=Mahanarva fimbriolata TaxID=672148 RepID=A0A7U3NJF0_9HEMI|nr:cathepsin L2 [Mahanarva fimbriolata]